MWYNTGTGDMAQEAGLVLNMESPWVQSQLREERGGGREEKGRRGEGGKGGGGEKSTHN